MITISVSFSDKRSLDSQFENRTIGCHLEASNLELLSSQEILSKTTELFALARASVDQQFARAGQTSSRWKNDSAHQNGGNGDRARPEGRTYSRPSLQPTDKQRQLLHRITRDRDLGPESIREMAERIVGKPVDQMDRKDMSRLIESLLDGGAA